MEEAQQTLEPKELERYARQIILPELGLSGQIKLKQARVLIVGAGGLGCPVLSGLAAAGVGTIKLVDFDLVELSNLHRQPLYPVSSLGLPKAQEAAKLLREINPEVSLIPISSRFEVKNAKDLLSEVDFVIDGSDNFATKYLLNDACVSYGKVLVSGSISRFEGQVSVFNAALANGTRGPTYRCLFPEPPPAELVSSCAEQGVLGVLPSIVGSLQAAEALKLILGIGELLQGRMLLFDALSMRFSEICFERNEMIASNTKIREQNYYANLAAGCVKTGDEISAAELKAKFERGESLVLIDVREAFEKERFDLGGERIALPDLSSKANRIPRDKPVVLYCHSGVRSRKGLEELRREFGFDNLLNLRGGIVAWLKEAPSFAITSKKGSSTE